MNTVEEIKGHLGYGDWRKVARMTGLTRIHVQVVMTRPGSKHYEQVFKAACKVATTNKKLGL